MKNLSILHNNEELDNLNLITDRNPVVTVSAEICFSSFNHSKDFIKSELLKLTRLSFGESGVSFLIDPEDIIIDRLKLTEEETVFGLQAKVLYPFKRQFLACISMLNNIAGQKCFTRIIWET